MADLMQQCSAPGCSYRECPGQGVCVRHGGQPKTDPPRGPGRAPLDDVQHRCTAPRRDGGPCRQPAIKGTRPGLCRMHGAAAPQVRAAAADRVVEESIRAEAHRYTDPQPTTPQEALQAELERTAGAIRYLQGQLERFDEPPAAWLAVYNGERAHMAKIAERMTALQTKTAEVAASIRGQLIDQLQTALVGILTDLGHDPDDDVIREVVALHLRRAAGGQAVARPQAPVRQPEQLTAPPPPPAAF